MTSENLGDTIRQELIDRILGGELAPGTRLDEQSIADEYQVSRTPVRAVLQQLAAAGLADIKPRRGAFVKTRSQAEIMDLFEAMGELEALCARYAAQRMTMIEIGQLDEIIETGRQIVENNDGEAYAELNLAFHEAIFEGAHNASLMEMAKILRLRTSPYRNAQFTGGFGKAGMDHARLETNQNEHEENLEAIRSKDGDAASSAMSRHITASSINILRMLSELR